MRTVPEGFTLDAVVGAGSVFEVVRVTRDGQRFACKRLRAALRHRDEAQAAFEREVALLETTQHPALPRYVERGVDGEGAYLIEEWVDGVPLPRWAAAFRQRRGELDPGRFQGVLRGAVAALATLHDGPAPADLVHGDLTPDHVMVDRTDGVRFVDLGQARWRAMPTPALPAERGTLPYASPELSSAARTASQADDVYALAAAFAEVALDAPLLPQEGAALLVEVVERGLRLEGLARATALGPKAARALASALAFDPAARTTRASALLAALDD